MSGPQLFTWFHHDSRPLSQWLRDSVLRRLLAELSDSSSSGEVVVFIDHLADRVDAYMPQALAIRSVSAHPVVRGGPDRPGPGQGVRLPTERWMFEVELDGDIEMLEWWPDGARLTLEPVGNRLEDEPSFEERRLRTAPAPTAEDATPAFTDMSYDTFLLMPALPSAPDRIRSLYITIDSTRDERRVHRLTGTFNSAMEARMTYLGEMCSAINEQVAAFRSQVADEVIRAARARQEQFEDDESILQALSISPSWTTKTPSLEPAHEAQEELLVEATVVRGHDETVREQDGQPSEADEVRLAERHDLIAPIGQRLSSASFEDIQLIIGVWAQGVHSYAKTFSSLSEDDLSCLLTATLKATTPGADHQVYRRAGKTDIVIRAEDLPDGHSNEPVFVCEAKKGTAGVAAKALEDQLLSRYTTVQDTAAVLLLYVTNVNFSRARRSALAAVRGVDGYIPRAAEREQGRVEGWPILTYRRRGRVMRVCIATIDLHFKSAPRK